MKNHNFLSAITLSFIIYHELEHLKMCLDTVTDMNATHAVPGDNLILILIQGMRKMFIMGSVIMIIRPCIYLLLPLYPMDLMFP